MSKYIVSLTPLGKYFFGGDMTFKVSEKNDYNERYSSYSIRSIPPADFLAWHDAIFVAIQFIRSI